MTSCEWCGEHLPIPERQGRPRRYCSRACQNRAHRERHRPLPEALTARARWVRWELRERRGRTTKIPLTIFGGPASVTDPRTWATYAKASASSVGAGLGIVLGFGVGVVDLDDAIEGGVIAPWAQEVLDANPDTFTEVSQSGSGIHAWGLLPEGRGRVIRDGRKIEIYSSGRFIALGTPMRGTSMRLRPLVVPE